MFSYGYDCDNDDITYVLFNVLLLVLLLAIANELGITI